MCPLGSLKSQEQDCWVTSHGRSCRYSLCCPEPGTEKRRSQNCLELKCLKGKSGKEFPCSKGGPGWPCLSGPSELRLHTILWRKSSLPQPQWFLTHLGLCSSFSLDLFPTISDSEIPLCVSGLEKHEALLSLAQEWPEVQAPELLMVTTTELETQR